MWRVWSQWSESNQRPTDYKSVALPTELHWQYGDPRESRTPHSAVKGRCLNRLTIGPHMVSHRRFELRTTWLKVKCSANWANGPYVFAVQVSLATALIYYYIFFAVSTKFFIKIQKISHSFKNLKYQQVKLHKNKIYITQPPLGERTWPVM